MPFYNMDWHQLVPAARVAHVFRRESLFRSSTPGGAAAGTAFAHGAMMIPRKTPTDSLITRAKRDAKRLTSPELTYTQALDAQAALAGYPDWRTLAMANGERNANHGSAFPLDPVLRPGFNNTPNDERSEEELETWWERPFIVTRDDREFDVYCLDGGAWDRATWYCTADTVAEAVRLGKEKLASVRESRNTPVMTTRRGGGWDLVILNQRPGVEPRLVEENVRPEDVAATLEKYKVKAKQGQ
jgi:hypothetical protein